MKWQGGPRNIEGNEELRELLAIIIGQQEILVAVQDDINAAVAALNNYVATVSAAVAALDADVAALKAVPAPVAVDTSGLNAAVAAATNANDLNVAVSGVNGLVPAPTA